MFGLFKEKELELYSPVCGKIIDLSEVKDQVFAQKMMGDGAAFVLEKGEVCAPCDCEVEMLFPTLHAIGLRAKNGTEILIHIGLDTVNLNGKGFKAFVKQGDRVKRGQKMIEVDLNYLKEKGIDATTPMIITTAERKVNVVIFDKVDNNDLVMKVV